MRWNEADIPDQHGRTAIVTGASSGVGYAVARELARRGARVLLASRDEARTKDAARRLSAELLHAKVEARVLDLASLTSVRRFAEETEGTVDAVDVLINNAGVSGGPRRESEDGFEMHFQVNYLGHYCLTLRLLPLLRRRSARVVSVSSDVASRGRIDFDDLQAERRYDFVAAYAQSKLANLLFAFELERRVGSTGVRSFAAHPGVAKSNLLIGKEADWGRPPRGVERALRLVQLLLAQPAARGALPALYQATSPEARSEEYVGPTGFLHGRGPPGPAKIPPAALDEGAAGRLWEASARLTGVKLE